MGWSYTIAPKTPLDKSLTKYDILIDSHLGPMDWWDEISWKSQANIKDYGKQEQLFQEAVSDTLDAWATKHMAFNKYPFIKTSNNPDFIITLKTEEYAVENVQTEVDFSDLESVICTVKATAQLTVSSTSGDILLNELITYYVDEENKSSQLPISHFMLNPVFQMKYNMKKKPEKKRKLLNRKLKRYEANVLEYFYVKSGEILKEHFLEQQKTVYAATYGVKNKGHEALNDASESAKKTINALSAFSKKKRKTLEEIQPEIEISMEYWQDKLERTTDLEIRKLLCANLSLGNLIMGNIEEAKKCLEQVPEYSTLEKKTLFEGGFNYYLSGLSKAIATKEQYGSLAQIH